MPYEDWGKQLKEHFPPRNPEIIQQEWEGMKERLCLGQPVSGVVVSRAPFGVWLDINAGFPALLLIPEIVDLTPEKYQNADWCPIGSTVSAIIVNFDNSKNQVVLSQRNRTFWGTYAFITALAL